MRNSRCFNYRRDRYGGMYAYTSISVTRVLTLHRTSTRRIHDTRFVYYLSQYRVPVHYTVNQSADYWIYRVTTVPTYTQPPQVP